MRILRWFVRLVGVGFLTGAFVSSFAVLLWPRWYTAAGASTVCICFTLASVLLIVASFMPNLDKLKQRRAPGASVWPISGVRVRCNECGTTAVSQCNIHKVALCTGHANHHMYTLKCADAVVELGRDAAEGVIP